MLIAGIYASGGISAQAEKEYKTLLAQLRIFPPRHVRGGWIRKKTKSARRERERYLQEIPHEMQAGYYNPRYKH